MNKIVLIILSTCLIHTAHGMEENNPDIELAPMSMIPNALVAQQPVPTNAHQEQNPPQPARELPPVYVHATASLNSSALERKFDELTTIMKKRPNGGMGIDGSFGCSGSICIGITLYYLFNGLKPTCNCSCPAQAPVMCSFPTPRPTPLMMDNGTTSNSTQTNITTNANSTMPASTDGFMEMLSTLMSANSSNDTMPSLAPTTKLKRD
jgi:hypothetical protein